MELSLGIHYINDEVKDLYEKEGGVKTAGSAGFDLICVEDMELEPFKHYFVNLGLIVNIPEGYYMEISPRSSIFYKNGVIQTNSHGIIDRDYSGPEDILRLPIMWCDSDALYIGTQPDLLGGREPRKLKISKGTRLCQFVLRKKIEFKIEDYDPSDRNPVEDLDLQDVERVLSLLRPFGLIRAAFSLSLEEDRASYASSDLLLIVIILREFCFKCAVGSSAISLC